MTKSSILNGRQIEELELVAPIGENCLKAASCDLRLGRDVFVCGQGESVLVSLEEGQDVRIEPFGSIIFSTKERIGLTKHRDIVGRFDLMVGFGLEGLMLQVGPQVEPGYEGPLFGLMLNTQGTPRTLSENERFLTIEFSRVGSMPDEHFIKLNRIDSLAHFLEHHTISRDRLAMYSAVKTLQIRIEQCRREHGLMIKGGDRVRGESGHKWARWAVIISILALILTCLCNIIGIVVALVGQFFRP